MQVPRPERGTTRGQIVRHAAAGVAAGMVGPGWRSQRASGAARSRDRVVVIGAGVAGEHTDTDQQGDIDGAVRTGERAARELIV